MLLLLLLLVVVIAVAVAVAVQDPSGRFVLALREPPNLANYDTTRFRLAKYLVNHDMKCFQEAPKPKKQILCNFIQF